MSKYKQYNADQLEELYSNYLLNSWSYSKVTSFARNEKAFEMAYIFGVYGKSSATTIAGQAYHHALKYFFDNKKEGKELISENFPTVTSFVALLTMIQADELSSRGAKDLLPFMLSDKKLDVKKIAEEKGLIQKSDREALKKIVEEVLQENPTQVADYKNGKESMFMYFVGQCMKKSKGAGNPSVFQEILKEDLI